MVIKEKVDQKNIFIIEMIKLAGCENYSDINKLKRLKEKNFRSDSY